MALHIQMSEDAEKDMKKTYIRNQVTSILVSLLCILLGGGALYCAVILIVQEPPAVFVSYVPPAENAAPTNNPTTQELTSKASSPSEAVSPAVIVSTGAAPVQMAAVEIEAADVDLGSGIDFSMGFGSGGIGDGLGDGGSGLGSGKSGGSALEGTFYDLKLTRSGAKTPIAPASEGARPNMAGVLEVYYNFTKGWNAGVLNKYYKAPTKLYASNFYLPNCDAKYGPKAYQCESKVKPSAWIAVYRGNVKAPKSGKFRFVGTGDDLLVVRFNKKTVLEAGWAIPSKYTPGSGKDNWGADKAYQQAIRDGKDKDHKDYEYVPLPGGWEWNNIGGMSAGTPFEVKEGQTYPIEVMISEGPGGKFGFALLIEDIDGNPQGKKPAGDRVYDLFRTNFSLPSEEEISKLLSDAGFPLQKKQFPKYNPDSLIWVAVP